jgi:hypothetical protein
VSLPPCAQGLRCRLFHVTDPHHEQVTGGCDKFAICGVIEQASRITLSQSKQSAKRGYFANVIVGDQEAYEMKLVNNTSLRFSA